MNQYRLREARKLLLTTARTVTDIAGSVGFDNVSYFDRIFKREYGLTSKEQKKLFNINGID